MVCEKNSQKLVDHDISKMELVHYQTLVPDTLLNNYFHQKNDFCKRNHLYFWNTSIFFDKKVPDMSNIVTFSSVEM